MRISHFYILFLAFLIIKPYTTAAQVAKEPIKPKWAVKDPFEQKVFIENKGQFDGRLNPDKGKILYSARINGVDIYFTSNGFTFRHDSIRVSKEKDADEEADAAPVIIPKLFSVLWDNSNLNTIVTPEEMVSFYYTYPGPGGRTMQAHAYKKLLYTNTYPGIDIKYSFSNAEKGLEYAIIVHPGADLSQVKELYQDARDVYKSPNGDIVMQSSFGQFTEQAPAKSYYQEDNVQVAASTELNGNTVSFNVSEYDHNKTLIIDPFIIDPNFQYDQAYDIDYDWQGNVYAYGSFQPYQVMKFDINGIPQWSATAFTSSSGETYYGDVAVNKANGAVYAGEAMSGPEHNIIEFNTWGAEVDSIKLPSMDEIWRMEYDACLGKVVIGGGGHGNNSQTGLLDTNLSSCPTVNTLGATGPQHDISLLALDEFDKNHAYFAVAKKNLYWNDTTFNNLLVKFPLPALTPASYMVPDGYSFYERNIALVPQANVAANGMNGMAVSPDWVYTYDGAVLKRFNKSTGSLSAQKTLSPMSYYWGGLDVDECNNIYVGCVDTIYILDSTLHQTGIIVAPDYVYDLHLWAGQLLVCGNAFIAEYPVSTNNTSLSITKIPASSCNTFDGKATAHMASCISDTSVYSYQWSNGQTTQTATGLSIGNYTVTVSLGCDIKYTDTVNILALPSGGISLSLTTKNEKCFGDSNASVTVIPNGGSMPYTYTWLPSGSSADSINNLKTGNYTVIVKDSSGCAAALISITQPPPIAVDKSYLKDVSCYGGNDGSVTVYSNGGTPSYTYSWQPTGGSANSLSNLTAGTYTVTVTDSNGCKSIDTIPITQPPPLNLGTVPVVDCYSGQSVTLNASANNGTPPYAYTWNYVSHDSTLTVAPLDTTTYIVSVTDAKGCTGTAYVTVDVLPPCTVFIPDAFSPNGDGQNDILYVRGSTCIQWLDLVIFDRWGNKVFESGNMDNGWDGTYKGQPMNTGTYVYYLHALTLYGKYISKNGTITLVR